MGPELPISPNQLLLTAIQPLGYDIILYAANLGTDSMSRKQNGQTSMVFESKPWWIVTVA